MPPAARSDVGRAEPATTDVTARVQQARIAVGIAHGFVHGNDVPQPHRFDLIIPELLTDEAGQFGVRGHELAFFSLVANLRRVQVLVTEETARKNDCFGRHATRRLEVRGTEHLLGIVTHTEAFALEPGDPVLAGRAIALDRKVDDAVFLAPGTSGGSIQDALVDVGDCHGITLAV